MLKKHLGNTFLLYLVVENLQRVHEISRFFLRKTGDLTNLSKFTDKHLKRLSGGVLSKDVLNSFVAELFKNTYFVEDYRMAGSETPVMLQS